MHLLPDEPIARFPLGVIFITAQAQKELNAAGQSPIILLYWHCTGQWHELGEEGTAQTERAVAEGKEIASWYRLASGTKVSICTGPDRSCTTLDLKCGDAGGTG